MKTKLICSAIFALAASFGAAAQDSATAGCVQELAFEPRLSIIAGKVDVVHAAAHSQAPDRVATPEERAAVGLWLHLRNECFEFGAAQRRAAYTAQDNAFVRAMFVFEQRLVAELQRGRVTYTEFNQRRLELVEAAGQEL